jgi:hypothetical protein
MITAFRPLRVALGVIVVSTIACQRMALLAPAGSTITLTPLATALPLNGTTNLIAQVIEPAGTPPQAGTLVTFTTSLGTIQPIEAETDAGGRVMVTFNSGTQSGTATIIALSGGVTTGAAGGVKIAIGAAAVGRIVVAANPTTVSAQGGVATITASVADLNGNLLGAIPVTFTTTAGTLGASSVATDSNGNAQTTLTTSVTATVTATAGITGTVTPPATGTTPSTGGSTSTQLSGTVTVNVVAAPTITITPPAGTLTAGSPISFALTVTPPTGGTTTIRDVTVDFGDGTRVPLGAIQGSTAVQHSYTNTAVETFTVRVTVTDSQGFTTSAATVIVVQPQPPLNVTISKASTPSGLNTIYTLTATVSPSSVTVANYLWVQDGSTTLQSGASNQLIVTYPTAAVHQITVTATTTTGQQATASVVVP